MPRPTLVNVLGVGVHAVDLPTAAELICTAANGGGQKGYVCLTGVHGVMEARRDPRFFRVLSEAMLVAPDGMPTVWVGHSQGHRRMRRVFGPDLMMEICRQSANNGTRHFLYGGNPGVAEQLANNLRSKFPAISIVGTFTPPFRELEPSEFSALKNQMEAAHPDIVWVGLSTPKQEKFMAAHIDRLKCKVMIGVGAAFDIHTGRIKDAPNWVKNSGLQWAHRLGQEPRRLWKRYLINNSAFVAAFSLQLTGLREYPLSQTSDPST